MRILLAVLAMTVANCFAQAPVETGRLSGEQLQRDQYKAGSAYRDLQNAERGASEAEKGYRAADGNYKDLQKRTEEARLQAEASKKKLEAAKAKEAQARKDYDAAVNAVSSDAGAAKK